MKKRRRFKQTETVEERVGKEAERLREAGEDAAARYRARPAGQKGPPSRDGFSRVGMAAVARPAATRLGTP